MRALAHDGLRLGRVVPEGGIFGARVQFGQAFLRMIEVKDASSADPATYRCLLRQIELRRALVVSLSRKAISPIYNSNNALKLNIVNLSDGAIRRHPPPRNLLP